MDVRVNLFLPLPLDSILLLFELKLDDRWYLLYQFNVLFFLLILPFNYFSVSLDIEYFILNLHKISSAILFNLVTTWISNYVQHYQDQNSFTAIVENSFCIGLKMAKLIIPLIKYFNNYFVCPILIKEKVTGLVIFKHSSRPFCELLINLI